MNLTADDIEIPSTWSEGEQLFSISIYHNKNYMTKQEAEALKAKILENECKAKLLDGIPAIYNLIEEIKALKDKAENRLKIAQTLSKINEELESQVKALTEDLEKAGDAVDVFQSFIDAQRSENEKSKDRLNQVRELIIRIEKSGQCGQLASATYAIGGRKQVAKELKEILGDWGKLDKKNEELESQVKALTEQLSEYGTEYTIAQVEKRRLENQSNKDKLNQVRELVEKMNRYDGNDIEWAWDSSRKELKEILGE